MKPKHLLAILPALSLLSACGQTPINLSTDNNLVAKDLTATPLELVVYPNDRPSIPDGAVVFQQNCAACHSGVAPAGGASSGANNAAGNTTANNGAANAATPPTGAAANAATAPKMPEGGVQPSSFKFDAQWAHSVKPIDIYRLVAFGGNNPDRTQRKHPAFSGNLTVTDLWNATVYVRSMGQPALNDKEIADVDPVFGSNCAVCHGTKGDGDGPLARNLDPMPANFQRFDRFFNRTDDVLFDHIANGIRWEGMPNFLGKKDGKKNVTFDEAYIRKLVQYVHKFHVNNAPVLTASAQPTKPAQ